MSSKNWPIARSLGRPEGCPDGTAFLIRDTGKINRLLGKTEKLSHIQAGISVPDAIHWFCEGCVSSWCLLSKQQQFAHIRELRSLLSDPLTADQAEALRRIGQGEQSMEEVIDWLRHAPMSREEHRRFMIKRVLSQLGPIGGNPRQGFMLDFQSRGRFQHTFCGQHQIPGGRCPNCNKPFLRLLSLDTKDPRLNLGKVSFPYLHLVYCWTCAIADDFLAYHMEDGGGIKLLYYGRGGTSAERPYPDYPEYFPGHRVELKALSRHQQDMIRVFNTASSLAPVGDEDNLIDPMHQVGGEPYVIESLPDMLCQVCGDAMPLLAAICDNAADSSAMPGYSDFTSFTHDPEIQVIFHYCRKCAVAGGYHIRAWDSMPAAEPKRPPSRVS